MVSEKGGENMRNSTNERIDPAPYSRAEFPEERALVCPKCGAELQPGCTYCQHCGKRVKTERPKKSFAKLAILLILVLCIVIASAYSFYLIGNYQSGVAAMDSQNFIAAQRYLDKIPYCEKLFPDECAYVQAGVLMETGDYFASLEAFDKLDGISIPVSLVENLTQKIMDAGLSFELFQAVDDLQNVSIPQALQDVLVENVYKQAQEHYRTCNYSRAKSEFTAIGNFKRSKDYRTLVDCRASSSPTNYRKLVKLLDFEDAKEIVLNTDIFFELYLDGEWKENGTSYYFEVKDDGSSCNLPSFNESGYYFLNNGYYSVGKSQSTSKKYFKFSIIDEDTISVYCYKDSSTHELHRQ